MKFKTKKRLGFLCNEKTKWFLKNYNVVSERSNSSTQRTCALVFLKNQQQPKKVLKKNTTQR